MAGCLFGLVITASAQQVTLFSDDFENGLNGWTVQNTCSSGGWSIDQEWSSSSSNSWHFKTVLGCGGDVSGAITSPSIAISGVTNAELKFAQCELNDWEWPFDDDYNSVEISDDGGATWQTLYLYNFADDCDSTKTYNISSYIGKTVKIRFAAIVSPYCLECSDPSESTLRSAWHIDDVRVVGE